MGQQKVTIVNAAIAELCADVPDLNARQRLMCIQMSYLNDKWLNAIIVLKRDTTCKNYCVGGLETEGSRPKLSSLYCW